MFARIGRIRLRWWVLLAVVVLLGQHLARWGRPLTTQFVLAGATSAGPAGREWRIERRSSAGESWLARDTNGDGVRDEFATPAGKFLRPGGERPPKRWLIICVDGVPLAEMQKLWDRGHFREFHRPTAVVSAFPSDSETAITEVLHSEPVPGYEHRYFHRRENQIRGGVFVTLTGRNIHYLRRFHYDAAGIFKGLHYVVPRKSYRADLGRLRGRFRESNAPVFVAHVSSTDSLYHVVPADQMHPLLEELEAMVRDLYLEARGELGVLLFSDHGNTLALSRPAPLEPLLERRGWQLRSRLEGPRDVAVPGYGLVGFAAVYCREEATAELAADLAQLEGADFVVYLDSKESAIILSATAGSARLRWSADGSRFWYETGEGDPLELRPVFAQLRAAGRLAEDGSAGDADLYAATAGAPYPDAAARLRAWATNHVQNRADLLVSLKPGYFHGSGVFQHIVDITGTHGAMEASSSLGFAMGTEPLPPTQRLRDLLPEEMLKPQMNTDQHN